MRWAGRRQSSNVEDRRGMRPRTMAVGGGVGGLVLLVLALLFGGNPGDLARQLPLPGGGGGAGGDGGEAIPGPRNEAQREMAEFVAVVLADTEDVWNAQFKRMGEKYREPKLVLFSSQVESGCGVADAGMGPFYCPADEKVYIDLDFFEELKTKFSAPGDFAIAYVVAHEVGHHVQRLLGYTERVHGRRREVSDVEYNQLSVRLELQADFLAGVWAHHAQRTKQILESGDIEEAMGAAQAVGDDRLQRQTRGRVVPDSFTHGSSEQRVRWFQRGFQSGDISRGDTFEVPYESL